MTNLSKQLCEICGIKPMYRLEGINALYNEDNYDEFCEMRLNKGLLIPTGTKAVFPDFTQSKNFVKLLKIANDVLGSVHFATAYTKNKPNLFEEQVLMHYIPIAKLNDIFKQAIRETEWVYG